jgi:hypothetical protein
VARSVLDDNIATFQVDSFAVIKLQPNLAFMNDRVVDGVRLVHCGIFFFKVTG